MVNMQLLRQHEFITSAQHLSAAKLSLVHAFGFGQSHAD
jgi:hypothetical protein